MSVSLSVMSSSARSSCGAAAGCGVSGPCQGNLTVSAFPSTCCTLQPLQSVDLCMTEEKTRMSHTAISYQQPFCLAVLVQGAWSLPNLHSHQELYPAIDTEMVPGYSVNNETTTCTFSPRPATHYHRHRRWSRIRAATTELHNVNAALDHMHLTKTRSYQIISDQIRSDQIRSDQVRSGVVRSGKVRSGEVR